MNRLLPPRYVILILGTLDPDVDVGKQTSAYAHFQFDNTGKTGLEDAADKFWKAASSLRSMMLLGIGIERVVVCYDLNAETVEHIEELRNRELWFQGHPEVHKLASFEDWVAPTELFMRLATIQKTLPEIARTTDGSRLISPELNTDRLHWTTWLSNHHVNFQSGW